MSEVDLAAVRKRHTGPNHCYMGCPVDSCDATQLANEVETLRKEMERLRRPEHGSLIRKLADEVERLRQRSEIAEAAIQGVLDNFKTCACRDYDQKTGEWGSVCMVHEADHNKITRLREALEKIASADQIEDDPDCDAGHMMEFARAAIRAEPGKEKDADTRINSSD